MLHKRAGLSLTASFEIIYIDFMVMAFEKRALRTVVGDGDVLNLVSAQLSTDPRPAHDVVAWPNCAGRMDDLGIDPSASRMQSERSTM